MASTKLISSQEHKISHGWAPHHQSQGRSRQNQSLGALCVDSEFRTCECAVQSSRKEFPSRDNLADVKTEPNSVCLMAMVDEYMEIESSQRLQFCGLGNCSHCCIGTCQREFDQNSSFQCQCLSSSYNGKMKEAFKELDSILRSPPAELKLAADVLRATKEVEYEKWKKVYKHHEAIISTKSLLRVFVLKYLKQIGYDAGICKSERGNINGFPVDEHEYVDVIVENSIGKTERIFVELSFRSQFKIARPSTDFKELLQMLPKIFVGNKFTLQRFVRLMSQATKTSLESQGMYVPPWRRSSFMYAKWLSRYARTTEPNLSNAFTNRNVSPLAANKDQLDQKRVLKEWNSVNANKSYTSKLFAVSQTQFAGGEPKTRVMIKEWQPPAAKPRPCARKLEKMVGALAMEMVEAQLNLMPKPLSTVS